MRMPPWLRRTLALIGKERRQIVRDPSSLLIAVVLPFIYLFLFGYGISLDLRDIDICAVVEQPTDEANAFLETLEDSRFFRVHRAPSRDFCERALVRGDAKGAIILASDFSRRLWNATEAPLQLLLDGTDPNTAALTSGYIDGAWRIWLGHEALKQAIRPPAAITLVPRVWFNQELKSRNFLLPGLIAVVMSLIGTLLTALVIAREWERGTMEALMSTPASIVELVAGKVIPYFVLGMGAMGLCVALGVFLFRVPFRGSLPVLVGVSSIFLLCTLALGLLISSLARSQFVASQIALIATILPAFMLSGLEYEISSMPVPIQALTRILPARYFVSAMQTLFLAGDVFGLLWRLTAAMSAIAVVYFVLVVRNTRTRLE
jgi:ABC-2 type transport system permease protein